MSTYDKALAWVVSNIGTDQWPSAETRVAVAEKQLPTLLSGWQWEHDMDGWYVFHPVAHLLITRKEWAAAVVADPSITLDNTKPYTPKPILNVIDPSALIDAMMAPIKADVGAHYRWKFRQKINEADMQRGYVVVNFDPYRVCKVWNVGGGPAEHIIKKAGRGVSKGHTELELIAELQSCLDRWKGMVNEDS